MSRSTIIVITFLLLFTISSSPSQVRKPKRAGRAPFLDHVTTYRETPHVTRVVLKNGMTVLVNEFRTQPVLSIQAHVEAGVLDDDPGVAQLMASLLTRGNEDFRRSLHVLGGIARSRAGYRTTVFEVVAPSSHWRRALTVHAGALLNPPLDPEDVKVEAGLSRIPSRTQDEFEYQRLLETAFTEPRMAQDYGLIGAAEPISAESLARFYRTRYPASRTTLVISGDITAGEVLNEVVRLYTAKPAPPGKPAAAAERSGTGFKYEAVRANIPFPRVYMGFHTVAATAKDHRAVEVLGAILGVGEGSILADRLKNRKGIVFSAETMLHADRHFGFLTAAMEMPRENIDRSEIAALVEIELLKKEGPSEVEMERAFAQLERAYWQSQETVSGRAELLARYETLGDWTGIERYISDLRKVTRKEVQRAAAAYLNFDNCTLVEYIPVEQERNLTADAIRSTLEGLLDPGTEQEAAEREKETSPAIKIPSSTAKFEPNQIKFPFQTASLLRGPAIFIREEHTSPLIDLGLFFPGGKLHETEADAGITRLMLRVMLARPDFHRRVEILGGRIRPVMTDDYYGFYFSVLSRNFGAGFDLLEEAIRRPVFEEEAVERQKVLQRRDIRLGRDSGEYAHELMDAALFAGFRYAGGCNGDDASLEKISRDSLEKWHGLHVRNHKPIVAAIGDTKGTSLANYFVKGFSGSRMQDTVLPQGFVKPLEKATVTEQDWGREETLVSLGFQAPPLEDVDKYAAAVLQSYAGGSGRLRQVLRDRMGAAHDVSVRYEPLLRAGSMRICAETNRENAEAVLKALRAEIRRITDTRITHRDLEPALNSASGLYMIGNQTRRAQIYHVTINVLAGKGLEGYNNYLSSVGSVSLEDFHAIAENILDPDREVTLVMRGKK